jgi:hypothetical protein
MNHVQIGPSALAHGLLIPCTQKAGFEVALIGRTGGENRTEYVHVDTKTGDGVPRAVALAEGPASLSEASERLREIAGSKEPLLITCTLREAIIERCGFVEELLEARPSGAETVFAACENTPDRAYENLEKACEAFGAVSLRTVVNRMCVEQKERDTEGRRVILAHPLGEWLFEAPSQSLRLLEDLSRIKEVKLVEDYEAHKDRKIWMVNGVHLVLGLRTRAAQRDIFETDEDLTETARRPEVLVQLAQLHGPMEEALKRRHPHLEGNLRYGEKHVLAYMEHPDSAERVLSNFTRRNLAPFIATMKERLGEPARICAGAGCSVDALLKVLDLFERVVKDQGAFVEDAAKIRLAPELVTEKADARAVAAYRDFLTGWADEMDERVARFADALEESSPH